MTATFCPRPFAQTRSTTAVVDDLLVYLRLVRAGVLEIPGTPPETRPQAAVA